MIKLIAIDLDGSLLSDDKQLPKDFWNVVNQLFEKNITVVIASGRPLSNVISVFAEIKDKLYFACDNGSFVMHANEEILVSPIGRDALKSFIEISRPIKDSYPVLCGKEQAYIENEEEEFSRQALKYYQKYEFVKDLTTVEDTIVKISFCDLRGSEENSYPFYKHYENDYNVAISGQVWLDITNKTASKGNAIKEIQRRLNISASETLVFGDYLNDLDMIENAGYSYAMKNAHPDILKAAKYITDLDNNEGGVTATICKLLDLNP